MATKKKPTAKKVSPKPAETSQYTTKATPNIVSEPESTGYLADKDEYAEPLVQWGDLDYRAAFCPEAALAVMGACCKGSYTATGSLPNIVSSSDGEYQAVKVEGGIELTYTPNAHSASAGRDRLVQLRDQLRPAKLRLGSVKGTLAQTPASTPQIENGLRASVAKFQAEVDELEAEVTRIHAASPELKREALLQRALHLDQSAARVDAKAEKEELQASKWREKGHDPYPDDVMAEMVEANKDVPGWEPPLDDRNEAKARENDASAEQFRRQAYAQRQEAECLKEEALGLPGLPEKTVTLVKTGSLVGFQV